MHFDKNSFAKLKSRLRDPMSNLALWLIFFLPAIAMLGWVAYLKMYPPYISKYIAPQTSTPELQKMAGILEPPDPAEGLHVVAYTPAGPVSTQTEGIKILFDHSMIAMTDVDPDKHPSVPLTINPPVAGEFVWYGTKGFVYRFKEALPPATAFEASLPKGLAALDKKSLDKDFKWKFFTPAPVASALSPQDKQAYVPPKTAIKISFSQAMQREPVEDALTCRTWHDVAGIKNPAKENCGLHFQFRWEPEKAGGETLIASPKEAYPPEAHFEIQLPAGLLPLRGIRGTEAPLSREFSTAGKMALEKVRIDHPYPKVENDDDLVLYQNEANATPSPKRAHRPETLENKFPTGDICFDFSNPVDRASFEKSLQLVPLGQTKPDPSFRMSVYYQNKVAPTEEELEAAETPADLPYLTACLSADLKYQSGYEIRFTKPINDRSGQTLDMKFIPLPLRFQTMHASLEGTLDITKNVFNTKKIPLLPFTSINSERVDIRLIPCALDSSNLNGSPGSCIQAHDQEKTGEADSTEASGSLSPSPKEDPLLRHVPIAAEYDAYHHGRIDLGTLYPNLKPGLYELEATFQPMSEITLKHKFKILGIEQEQLVSVSPVAAKKRLQLAETALALKTYENQCMIWAVDIGTGEPRPGIPIEVWEGESLLASGWTNEEGIFNFINNTVNPGNGKLKVVATDPASFGLLSSEDTDGITPQDYGVSYVRPGLVKNYFAFLHSDRPLYRPGQTVYFSGFLRGLKDGVYHLPRDLSSIEVKITDASNNQIYRRELPISAGGAFGDKWALGDDEIPRGRYQITASIPTKKWSGESEAQTFTKAFYVASYKKPDFKVGLQPDHVDVISGEPIRITAKGSYFFGAPLANAQIDWSIRRDGFRFAPEKFQDFMFVDEEAIQKALKRVQEGSSSSFEEREDFAGDGEEVSTGVYSTDSESRLEDPKLNPDKAQGPKKTGISTKVISAQQADLGADGLFVIETTPELRGLPTSQIYTATLTAKEWGQEVSAVSDIRVHQSSVYVGLKPGRRVYAKGERFAVDLVTLDPEAKAVANRAVSLRLFKRDYTSIKKRTEDGSWTFESEPKDTLVEEAKVTTDTSGKARYTAPAAAGGVYRIVASVQDDKGRIQGAAVHVDVGGDNAAAWQMGAENRLEIVPDKASYKVGETAQILLPISTVGMRALLTVERAGILQHQLIQFAPNQNTVSVPIREDYIPNIYVGLLLFRPQDKDYAMMKVGLTELKVEPEKKRLTVALKPDKTSYAPKEKVHLSVHTTDSSGKGVPADLIVSVADESVLRLIDYQSPDLMKRFYFNRKLGVLTAENMVHYKSGDMGEADVAEKKRSKFLDTAFFTSSVRTDANGAAELDFDLPDNITTWVAEAFAVSEDTKVGSTFTSFPSLLPVFLRPALPRFLAVEDAAQPIVYVENPAKDKFEGTIQIKVAGAGRLTSPPEQAVSVEAGGRTPISFGLSGIQTGESKVTFSTRGAQQQLMDVLELPLPVKDRSVPSVYSAGGATRATAAEQLKIPAGVRQDRGELRLSVGTSPMRILLDAMKYLFEFPYGCAEQRTSALLGLWQLWDIAKAQPSGFAQLPAAFQKVYADSYKTGDKPVDEAQLKRSLEAGLANLYPFQRGDGGFGFWQEDANSDAFLSAGIARALRLWADAGIAVDADVRSRLDKFLAGILGRQKPLPPPPPGKPDLRQYEADSRGELAWGLALTDPAAALPTVKSLLEIKDVLGPRGLATLILAIQAEGKDFDQGEIKGLAKLLRKQAKEAKLPQGAFTYWEDSGKVWDPVHMSAVAMQALLAYDPKDDRIESTAGYLLSRAKSGNFGNTQATRESLLALARFSSTQQKNQETVATTTMVGKDQKTENLPAYSLNRWLEEVFPIAQLPQGEQPFDMKVAKPEQAPGALYYQANLSAYFPMDQVPRIENGLIVSRDFYDIDDRKEEHPLREFKIGKNYKATLTVMVSRPLTQLTVEHLLPAGLEPVDFSLATSNQELAESLNEAERTSPAFTPSAFGHEEIHDDRVMWSGSLVPAGIYTLRHVVLAATVGQFQAPGATVFPFYNSDYFGRSRSMVVKVGRE